MKTTQVKSYEITGKIYKKQIKFSNLVAITTATTTVTTQSTML